MSWFSDLPASTQGALIVAGAALTSGLLSFLGVLGAVILRDFWAAPQLEVRREDRERERAAFSVYRSYVDPLAAASTSVFWRLHEAFYDPGRAAYLKFPEPVTEFQHYKKQSTIYRLAALFGWIQAFRRELSFFTLDDKTRVHDVEEAVRALEQALAEGRLVEAKRTKELAELWHIGIPRDPDQISEASVKMEEAVKTKHRIDELWRVAELTYEEKLGVCATAASSLVRSVEQKKEVSQETLEAEVNKAVDILAVREAWIFRDQQAAIGDVMLEQLPSSSIAGRRFDVKGYAAFDAMMNESMSSTHHVGERIQDDVNHSANRDTDQPFGQHPGRKWLELIEKMLDGVDVSRKDHSDARPHQLREVLVSTARILVSVANVKERPGSVTEATVEAAKKVLKDHKEDSPTSGNR